MLSYCPFFHPPFHGRDDQQNIQTHQDSDDQRSLINQAVDVVAATGFDRTKCMKAVSKIEITPDMDLDRLIDAIFMNIEY